ncbi:unnamed protein product [Caenorhabditis auriculariae]|uniref:Striatin N-terminal domain-containing protein n=1 Tax=Caenorhabditis auriculariae TaxID=2777116 RepID=A0A8S1HJ69_9PELO|nr:unnamed protein product [Caenorhabditis auriculariae]
MTRRMISVVQRIRCTGFCIFLQHEWSRYELERTRWEAERAEMQARIAFLTGERKGQENLKVDLVRRVKMLEFCLKQERAKNYRLTHNGEDPPTYEETEPPVDSHVQADLEAYTTAQDGGGSWKQGRQLLKKYLEEIGYSEQILDNDLPSSDRSPHGKKDRSDSDSDNEGDGAHLDADATEALDEFSFLKEEPAAPSIAEMNEFSANKEGTFDRLVAKYKSDPRVKKRNEGHDEVERERQEVRRESNDRRSGSANLENGTETEFSLPPGIAAATAAESAAPPGIRGGRRSNFGVDLNSALGLPPDDTIDIKDDFAMEDDASMHPTKWNLKVTLRSHLDSIRAMQFHPVEPVLVTASEDGTAKLWNLEQKREDKHATGAGELEPVYTFRGHMGPVLCLELSPTGDHLYTGGVDGVICCWNVPSTNCDPFDPYDPKVLPERLEGHTDAVWSVAFQSSNNRIVSASSDSTIRLWEPGNGEPLVRVIEAPRANLIPTSVDFVSTETNQLLAAYTQCFAQIIDVETGAPILVFDFGADATAGSILTRIVSHPTMPIAVIGGDDRKIRYFDTSSGSLIHSSVAHVEGVSSLAIDPNGLYLLSGSHDGSLRLWNMEKKVCLQEISAHRKKYDAAVTSVAFHPSRPLIGSAGADSLAKVYISNGE